ncbi:MAG: response regulator transcription factor [Enterococcus casseliflavus]|nr:response regulator transcription factor [Enterococcus casseliflavus]MBS5813594.1 response regulator transcription factor [Enterococcus casseliflavus]
MRALVKTYAEIEGYLCFEAADGKETLEKLTNHSFDLILLDVMMPGKDGFQTLSEIRGSCNTPVIMITARKEEYDKLFGFNLGADDYIAKPFSPKELMARIKAVLKRSNQFQFEKIVFGDLEVNVFSHTVTIKGNPLPLTPKEFDLLVYLTKNNHIALSRESILEGVWGFDYFGDTRTVDTHIKSLRERLGDYRELIQTVWGVGYKFDYED